MEILPDNQHLVVSTGSYGVSKIIVYKFNIEACSFEQTFLENLDPKLFGEGLTRVGDKVYQLTWRE